MQNPPTLALLIPCYNEEEMIEQSLATLSAKMRSLIASHKIAKDSFLCFIDDGSTDNTWEKLCALLSTKDSVSANLTPNNQNLHKQNLQNLAESSHKSTLDSPHNIAMHAKSAPPIEILEQKTSTQQTTTNKYNPLTHADTLKGVVLRLSGNRGTQSALLCALEFVKDKCDCAISIDCDLQQDIQKLDDFIAEFTQGADIVYGIRTNRASDSFTKKHTALLFYRLMNLMGAKTIYNHSDYRLLSARAIDALLEFKEVNLFLRGLVPLLGFKSARVYFDVRERTAGSSKYSFAKLFSLAWNGITSFSVTPLRIISMLGVVFFLISMLYGGYVLYAKFFTTKAVQGWASTLIIMCFFSGVQLLSLGVIGEYIGKIYIESKKRPRYFLQEVLEGQI